MAAGSNYKTLQERIMRIDPIIPIWLMLILCVGMAFLKRRKRSAYIRQIAAIILIFLINLRIMVPSSNVETSVRKLDTYVLFVVDDTISMLAQDYAGDTERLTAVKKDCEHIVDEMDGAKFAVITFNNSANLISPYSDDSNFAKSVLDSIYPSLANGKSNINGATFTSAVNVNIVFAFAKENAAPSPLSNCMFASITLPNLK